MSKIRISCPASCGELFQCVVDGEERLLSYGIDKRSFVTLSSGQSDAAQPGGDKVRQALALLPDYQGAGLTQLSAIPQGKGYSSSTADMVSALQAVSLYQQRSLSAEELTRLCARIEPTDSVAFADWTVINPLSGELVWQTDWQPELYVYILEPIETVPTLDLVRMKDCPLYPAEESSQLFPLFQQACLEGDLAKIGQLATFSTLLNDRRLPKPYLKDIISLARAYGCLGVNIAHSGTLVGLLLERERLQVLPILEREIAQTAFADYYQKRSLSPILYEGVRQWEDVTD